MQSGFYVNCINIFEKSLALSKKMCYNMLWNNKSDTRIEIMEEIQVQAEETAPATQTTERTHAALPPKITKEHFAPSKRKRDKAWLWIKSVLLTLLSSFLIGFSAYTLITPNKFTIGGASGIAILVNIATQDKIPQSIILFAINLPLIVLSFFFVKKKFAVLSAMNIGLQSLWLLLLEQLFPATIKTEDGAFIPKIAIIFPGGEPSKLFAALGAGLLIGLAIALAFKVGGSTGGTDILAVMIQKKVKATSISWMLFIINVIIISASFFVIDPKDSDKVATEIGLRLMPIALAAFEAFIESRTNESILNGFQSAIEFRIITDKSEEMATAIMKELSRGVTAIPATGMYTKIAHTMLVCVVSRRQVATLQRIMQTVDPDSFAVTSKATQVLGLGFFNGEV